MSALTESEKRVGRAALEALLEKAVLVGDAAWARDAIAHLDALPTADEPAPAEGFTAWVTRDRGSNAAEVWTVEPPTYSGATWVARYSTSRVAPLSIRDSDALLGDARGERAIRRVRIVPDGEVGSE